MDKDMRDSVREFYGAASKEPVAGLCCPVNHDEEDVAHIPKEALDIAYGCGSPVALADMKEGETVVDLGSGGGIDCFIAAKKVGMTGKVFGIDMTEEMLIKAKEASVKVSLNLGYDNVEFRKGYLEEAPLEDGIADVVTSNCVINLAPDKGKVLGEMHRLLKHKGRFCISDIVTDRDVPENLQSDKKLWGECIAGAMREDEFINICRSAGFYGLHIVSRYLYREINGIRFYSITLKGYKFRKGAECVYRGQFAIYNGPFKSVWDDDGHEYPAGQPFEVCTDTAEKLSRPPYEGFFTITDAEGQKGPVSCKPGRCC